MTRVCPTCGDSFAPRAAQKFCSRACIRWSGINRRAGSQKVCPTCGEQFYVRPSRIQTYCSSGCVPYEVRYPPGRGRKGRPSNCAQCGDEFYARPSDIANGRKFCSRACWIASDRTPSEDERERKRQANADRHGSKNPNFKTGRSTGRQIRSFTLKLKGEDRCRNCGSTGEGLVHGLHLHHVIPRSLCRETRDKLLNGIPLCPKCHRGWHCRSVTIHREVFTAEEWAFLSSVKLTGQNIAAWLDDRYPPRPTCGTAATTDHPTDHSMGRGEVVVRTLRSSREVPR